MKTNNVKTDCYRFTMHAAKTPPDIFQEEKITPEQFLKAKYQNRYDFGTENLVRTGHFRIMGWIFDFRPFLKLFLVKSGRSWDEVWAPNKTLARKITYGRIDGIVEYKA